MGAQSPPPRVLAQHCSGHVELLAWRGPEESGHEVFLRGGDWGKGEGEDLGPVGDHTDRLPFGLLLISSCPHVLIVLTVLMIFLRI